MTRIPELERQLVAAAASRRRIVLPRIPWGLLVPVAATLLIGIALVRLDDPEVEAPTRSADPQPTLEDLQRGPLGPAIDGADPEVAPVSLRLGPWTVAAWGEPGGYVCQGATAQPHAAVGGGGNACSSAGLTAGALRRDGGGSAEMLADDGQQLVYGLAEPEVEAIEVQLGDLRREAELSDQLVTIAVTQAERDAVELDGGLVPPAGPVRFRLFAASFPDDPSLRNAGGRLRVTHAGGTTDTVPMLANLDGYDEPPVGCYREASLDADVSVENGEGSPVEVCRRFWEQTGFRGTPAPEQLTLCLGKDGAPLVFPGGPEVCAKLGLG